MWRLAWCLLLTSAPRMAQGEPPPDAAASPAAAHYVFLRLGKLVSDGAGLDGELTAGLRILPHLAVELGLGSYASKHSTYSFEYMTNTTYGEFKDDRRVTSATVGLRIFGERPVRDRVFGEFSLLGGLGIYRSGISRTHKDALFFVPGGPETITYSVTHTSEMAVGVHAGAAAIAVLPLGLWLGAEGRLSSLAGGSVHVGAVVGYEL